MLSLTSEPLLPILKTQSLEICRLPDHRQGLTNNVYVNPVNQLVLKGDLCQLSKGDRTLILSLKSSVDVPIKKISIGNLHRKFFHVSIGDKVDALLLEKTSLAFERAIEIKVEVDIVKNVQFKSTAFKIRDCFFSYFNCQIINVGEVLPIIHNGIFLIKIIKLITPNGEAATALVDHKVCRLFSLSLAALMQDRIFIDIPKTADFEQNSAVRMPSRDQALTDYAYTNSLKYKYCTIISNGNSLTLELKPDATLQVKEIALNQCQRRFLQIEPNDSVNVKLMTSMPQLFKIVRLELETIQKIKQLNLIAMLFLNQFDGHVINLEHTLPIMCENELIPLEVKGLYTKSGPKTHAFLYKGINPTLVISIK